MKLRASLVSMSITAILVAGCDATDQAKIASGKVSGQRASATATSGASEPMILAATLSGTSTTQLVLTPTSGGSLTDASGATWTLTSAGVVMKNGTAVPGGSGTGALTYVSSTKTIWGQDASSKVGSPGTELEFAL